MKLHMARHPLAEGLALQLQAMNEVAQTVNQINVAIAKRAVEELAETEELALPEPTPEPEAEAEAAE